MFRSTLRAVLLVTFLPAVAAAQSYELSDALVRKALGQVSSFTLSPDGAHAAFVADRSVTEDVEELWSAALGGGGEPVRLDGAPAGGTAPLRFTADGLRLVYLRKDDLAHVRSVLVTGAEPPVILNPAAIPSSSVRELLLSPDGRRAVYLADQDTDGVVELFSVPVDGSGAPVQLSGPLVSGGDVSVGFRISPDSARAVYRADQDMDQVFDLYSAPLDGSAPPERLNLTRPAADVRVGFEIAWDSRGVVYVADQDTDEVFEQYAVGIDGSSPPSKRSGAFVAGGDIWGFALSPVDDRLVYRADQGVDDAVELYSTRAITGGTPVKLNAAIDMFSDVAEVQLSADGRWAVYRKVSSSVGELYSVRSDGSSPATLLASGVGTSPYRIVGERLLFERGRLFSVPLDASAPAVNLEGSTLGTAERVVQAVLPDGTVLFTADREDRLVELYSVPIDGASGPRKVNAWLVSHGAVLEAQATMDGSRVVYRAEQNHPQQAELFSVSTAGGKRVRISGEPPLGKTEGTVRSFVLTPDATRVVYSTVWSGDGLTCDLYSTAADGSGRSLKLDRPHGDLREITGLRVSPDGARVVYWFGSELYSAPLDVARSAVRLGAVEYFPGASFAVTPDSSQVLFTSDRNAYGAFGLYLVPIDGSAPPQSVGARPAPSSQSVLEFSLRPDGAWIVYRLRTLQTHSDLYSMPLDGHQPPQQLNPPLAGCCGNVARFTVAPDWSRVVYVADQDAELVDELYSVPADGSELAVKLNGPLCPGGDVAAYYYTYSDPGPIISPDSQRVVYRADAEVDARLELYSAPLDGSSAAVKLNGSSVAGGNVESYEIDPASSRVVYAADEEQDAVLELYSAPLDGSAPRTKLNPPLAAGGSLWADGRAFRIGHLGRVLYLADQGLDGVFELFGVPLDGSAPAVALNGPLPPGGDVIDAFDFTADGMGVLYVAEQEVNNEAGLYLVPATGGASPRRLSGQEVHEFSSEDPLFLVSPDGERVLYRSTEQPALPVDELHACLFSRPPRRVNAPSSSVPRTVFR